MGENRRPLVNGVEVAVDGEEFTAAQLREAAGVPAGRLLAVLDGEANRLVSDDEEIRPEWRRIAAIPRFRYGQDSRVG